MVERERAIREIAARAEPVSPLRRFFFSSIFYTAMVGAIGAWIGWALLEPFFEDVTTITGRIEQTFPDRTVAACETCQKLVPLDAGEGGCPVCGNSLKSIPAIRGMLQLSRTELYLVPGTTRVLRRGRQRVSQSIDVFEVGQRIRARAQPMHGQSALALKVEIDPPMGDKKDPGEPNLEVISKQTNTTGLFWFAVIGGLVALMVSSAEGAASMNLRQSLVSGGIGLGIGFAGGLVGLLPAGLIYAVADRFVSGAAGGKTFFTIHDMHGSLFFAQIARRSVAWGAVGLALALGQGVARRSKKLIINGLIGGCLGGLFGGMLFDPIAKLAGDEGAELSRCIGFTTVGLMIGFFIGLVEQLSKEAWLLLRTGPLAGKQFVVHKSPTTIGGSSQCDVYLFKDSTVGAQHAQLTRVGRSYEIADLGAPAGTLVNGTPVQKHILRDGDLIAIGSTLLEYKSTGV